MQEIFIGYFCMMAAFMLTLDFSVSFYHLASVLFLLAIYLYKNIDTTINGFLTVLRAVGRIE